MTTPTTTNDLDNDAEPMFYGFSRLRHICALGLVAAIVVPVLSQLPGIRVDNDVEHWLKVDDGSTQLLDWFVHEFPVKERLFISWPENELDSPVFSKFATRLKDANEVIAGVASPTDLINAMVDLGVDKATARNRLRGYLLGNNSDSTRAGLLIFLTEEASKKPRTFVERLKKEAAEAGINPASLSIAGGARVRAQLDAEVDHVVFNPEAPRWRLDRSSTLLCSVIVGLTITVVMLRDLRLSGLVLTVAIIATLVTLALLPITGGSLNIVLLVMPTLVFVVTLSASIHVVNYWKMSNQTQSLAGTVVAQRTAIGPCLLASTTTAIGLASLANSPLTPVRQFGFYSAAGAGLAFVFAVIVVPALLWVMFRRVIVPKANLGDRFTRLSDWTSRNRIVISSLCFVVLAAALYSVRSLRTESRIVRYFPEDSEIVAGYRDIETHISGVAPIQAFVVLDSAAQEELRFRERLELLRTVSREIESLDPVTGTLCLADFLSEVPKPSANAPFLQKARWYKAGREMEKRVKEGDDRVDSVLFRPIEEADEFTGIGDELWGITAHVQLLPDDLDYERVLADIEQAAANALPSELNARVLVTGTVPQLLRVQKAVLDSLVVSFVTAFGVIAVVLSVYLRDPIASLLLMIPNLLPVAAVFGTLAWFNVAVDIGTMLTASVALGIAVDDSVHILVGFRNRARAGVPVSEAVAASLQHSGLALIQTTFVLSSGLLVLGSADMRLISQFGLVMASLLFMALVADLVLLPAMLHGHLGRRLAGSPNVGMPDPSAFESPSTEQSQPSEVMA